MIQTKNVTRYGEIFNNTFMEPSSHGFSVFTQKGTFIGEMMDSGFAINDKYEHKKLVLQKLAEKGIPAFDYDTFYEIELERIISE